jgi:hypothetical protein
VEQVFLVEKSPQKSFRPRVRVSKSFSLLFLCFQSIRVERVQSVEKNLINQVFRPRGTNFEKH